jgi:hypothetical protein
MIRRLNLRPSSPLGPWPVGLGLALFFGGLPLFAWWLDWHHLVGPAIILALLFGGVLLGARLNRANAEEAQRRELQRRIREDD